MSGDLLGTLSLDEITDPLNFELINDRMKNILICSMNSRQEIGTIRGTGICFESAEVESF